MSTYVSIYSLITQLVKNSPPGDPSSIPESGKIPWRRDRLPTPVFCGFACGLAGKESSHNVGDLVPSLGWEDALEKKKSTPSSFLAWRTPWTIHGVTKSQTRLSNFPFHFIYISYLSICFAGGSVIKNPCANAGDAGSIPGLGRSSGGGNGNPLQYSCLKSPMDRKAWWAVVHTVAKESDMT